MGSFSDWEEPKGARGKPTKGPPVSTSTPPPKAVVATNPPQKKDFWRGSLACSSIAHLVAFVLLFSEGAFFNRHLEPEVVYSISFEGGKTLGGIEKTDDGKKSNDKVIRPETNTSDPTERAALKTEPDAISLKAKPTPRPTPTVVPKNQKKEPSKPTPKPTPKAPTKATVAPTKEPTIDELNKAIQAATKKHLGTSSNAGGKGIGAAKVTGGNDTGGGVVRPPEFFAYRRELEAHVKRGWRWFDPQAALSAQIVFEISPTGQLSNITIVRGSGDDRFDQSVVRAVNKANPVPVPPEKVYQYFKSVRMTFEPQN